MTERLKAKELEKILANIDLSSLSDKEFNKLFNVIQPFYHEMKYRKNYLDYANIKRKRHF